MAYIFQPLKYSMPVSNAIKNNVFKINEYKSQLIHIKAQVHKTRLKGWKYLVGWLTMSFISRLKVK